MTALKGEAISRFIKSPDKAIVLVYGPDTGLISERAGTVIDTFLGSDADAMARTVIDGDGLPGSPERLAEEAHSVPMFGGRRAIRVTAGSRNIMPAVQPRSFVQAATPAIRASPIHACGFITPLLIIYDTYSTTSLLTRACGGAVASWLACCESGTPAAALSGAVPFQRL